MTSAVRNDVSSLICTSGQPVYDAFTGKAIATHDPEASRGLGKHFAAKVYAPSLLAFMGSNAEEMKAWVDRVIDKLANLKEEDRLFAPHAEQLADIVSHLGALLSSPNDPYLTFLTDAKVTYLNELNDAAREWSFENNPEFGCEEHLSAATLNCAKRGLKVLIDSSPSVSDIASTDYNTKHSARDFELILSEICRILEAVTADTKAAS